MRKFKISTKLNLNKMTITDLTQTQLDRINGGMPDPTFLCTADRIITCLEGCTDPPPPTYDGVVCVDGEDTDWC